MTTVLNRTTPAFSTPVAFGATLPATTDDERVLFHAIVDAWKKAANAKTTTAAQHAAYTLLRGRSIDKAFTPITNQNKIVSNGNNPHARRDEALQALRVRRADALMPWAHLLKDVPMNKYGTSYEGNHPLLDKLSERLSALA